MRSCIILPAILAAAAAANNDGPSKRETGTPCASLTAPAIPGASVVSVTGSEKKGRQSYCEVVTYLTHGTANDKVKITTWLPAAVGWNGRFQGIGGGGMITGNENALGPAVAAGYAAGTTDAGLPNSADGSAWAGDAQLVTNYGYLAVHEMTVVGKAVAAQYYGRAVRRAYWNGCSTGGRQGHMEAQRYPADYDGIYAAAPAIAMDRFHVAMLWPFVVQTAEGEFVPPCVFDALTAAAVRVCAGPDGLVADPNRCGTTAAADGFDPAQSVGVNASCAAGPVAITARQAAIFAKIMRGPVDDRGQRLWFGIAPGASYASLAGSTPFTLASSWTRNFVLRQPAFDLKTLTYASFVDLFRRSEAMYRGVVAADDPDLSAFRQAGGKLLSWHGWADQLIFANGTLDYRERVQQAMGGAAAVDAFYRLFMAPGVQHCGGGTGAAPSDPFAALVSWVETGQPPDTLAAAGNGLAKNLCRYPTQLKYRGDGDVKAAASWSCV